MQIKKEKTKMISSLKIIENTIIIEMQHAIKIKIILQKITMAITILK